MMSQGRKAIDDMFILEEGMICLIPLLNPYLTISLGRLTMYLGKESYERAGLVGNPYGAKGSRKLRPRWGRFSKYHSIPILTVCK